MRESSVGGNPFLAALLIAGALVLFAFVPSPRGLAEPDEARHAEVAREMAASGDWVVPTLYHVTYLEKPPLFYWILGGSISLFGATENAVRWPVALIGLATIAATAAYAGRAGGGRLAAHAALVLAASGGFLFSCRLVLLDVLFAALIAGVLFLFHALATGRARKSRPLLGALYFLLGLAVLTKGPTGAAIPLVAGAAYFTITRSWRTLPSFRPLFGAAVLVAVTAPWFALAESRSPGFLRFFLLDRHWARFRGDIDVHHQPWHFYFPVVLGAMLPWTFLAPAAAFGLRREPATAPRRFDSPFAFCVLAAFVVVGVFTASATKLPSYVLPAAPALAVVAAIPLDRFAGGAGSARAYSAAASVFAAVALAFAAVGFGPFLERAPVGFAGIEPFARAGALALGAGLLLSAVFAALPRFRALSIAAAAAGTALGLGIALRGADAFDPLRSLKPAAAALRREMRPGDRIVDFRRAKPSLLFYTDLRPTYVGDPGELRVGLASGGAADPGRYLPKEEIGRVFAGPERVLCVVAFDKIDLLERQGIAPHVLWNEGEYAIVSNRPPSAGDRPPKGGAPGD